MGIRQLKPRENWTKKWLDELLQSLPTKEIRKIIVETTEDYDLSFVLWELATFDLKLNNYKKKPHRGKYGFVEHELNEGRNENFAVMKAIKNFAEKCSSRKTLVRILKRIVRGSVKKEFSAERSIRSIFSKFLDRSGDFGSYIPDSELRTLEKRITEKGGVAHAIKVYKINEDDVVKTQLWPVLSQYYYSHKKNRELKKFLLKVASNESLPFSQTAQAILSGKRVRYVDCTGHPLGIGDSAVLVAY